VGINPHEQCPFTDLTWLIFLARYLIASLVVVVMVDRIKGAKAHSRPFRDVKIMRAPGLRVKRKASEKWGLDVI
jgi:hypothetical protein